MPADSDFQNVSETPAERRQHPRYRFSVPMTIRSADGAEIPGISIEISNNGISAITANPLVLNETVELDAVAGEKVHAQVRHNVGRIYGFEFLDLTADQSCRIAERCKTLPLYRGTMLAGLL